MTDAELIERWGGSSALAKRLGFEGIDGARRVNNWKRRGIPSKVKLENLWMLECVPSNTATTRKPATEPA